MSGSGRKVRGSRGNAGGGMSPRPPSVGTGSIEPDRLPTQRFPAVRPEVKRPVRIANASGFLGDRARAFEEVVTGGSVHFHTGLPLAKDKMLILGRQRMKDPTAGYAKAFLRHLEPVLGTILSRGIKVVVNAGGLNPSGLA